MSDKNYEEKWENLFGEKAEEKREESKYKLVDYCIFAVLIFFTLLPFYHITKRVIFSKAGIETVATVVSVTSEEKRGYSGNGGAGSSHKYTSFKERYEYSTDKGTFSKKKGGNSSSRRGNTEVVTYHSSFPSWIYWGEKQDSIWGILYLHKIRGWIMWGVAFGCLFMLWIVLFPDKGKEDGGDKSTHH